MATYKVDIKRTIEASAVVEVKALTNWEAREKALEQVDEDGMDFSTYDTNYEVTKLPTYVRPANHVNKFTPYWDKLLIVLQDFGYTLEFDDGEDEPSYFSKGRFVKGDFSIKGEVYLYSDSEDEKERGGVKIDPVYPEYDFTHTHDPGQLNFGLTMAPKTFKSRLTKFVNAYELAHADSVKAQEELVSANEKGRAVGQRISKELKILSYNPITISAYRRCNEIVFSISGECPYKPEEIIRMAQILEEEGIM